MLFDAKSNSLTKRSELPDIPGAPKGAAWFWGKDDELGRLNLLTPERTAAASKLIKTGQVVNLNLPTNLPNPPVFRREAFQHTIKPLGQGGFDDLYNCNTQSGSQWDGFRHVGHENHGKTVFYNNTPRDEILRPGSTRNGMQAWANHGIVGRGVLIDYWEFAKKSYDPNTTHRITLKEILEIAKLQNIEFKYGDILIIRSGWVDDYNKLDSEARETLAKAKPAFVGVEQTEEMLDFLHDNYFSAVAGDTPAFEAWPSNQDWLCHQFLLPLWGVPIGEMWDLEKLAETCKEQGIYEFYFSSIPTNVPGGVGSYPNALAIF